MIQSFLRYTIKITYFKSPKLFGKVTMASSGTMPQIYAIVLPKKKKVEEPFSNTESAPMRHKPFKTAVFDPR